MDNIRCKYCNHVVEVTQIRIDKDSIEILVVCDNCSNNNYIPIKKNNKCEFINIYTRSVQRKSVVCDTKFNDIVSLK